MKLLHEVGNMQETHASYRVDMGEVYVDQFTDLVNGW